MPDTIILCINTGMEKIYYRAEAAAAQLLSQHGAVVKTDGVLPDGEITEYLAQTMTKMSMAQGKLNGTSTETDCGTGAKLAEAHYSEGQLHGERKNFYPDGHLRAVETFKAGKLDGPSICYFPSGEERLRDVYAAGELQSRAVMTAGQTAPAGQPVSSAQAEPSAPEIEKASEPAPEPAAEEPEVPLTQETPPSEPEPAAEEAAAQPQPEPQPEPAPEFMVRETTPNARIYTLGGKEVCREVLSPAGEVIDRSGPVPDGAVREYYANGKLKVEETYQNGVLNGPRIKYDELGRKWAEETYQDGALSGLVRIHNYFKDKVFEEEATFKNNKLNGMRRSYYPNKHVSVEETYKDGLLDGTRRSYYENTRLNTEETYVHDRLNGPRKRYYDTGQLWNEELYENGQLNGTRFDYYISGQVRLEENYKAGRLEGKRVFYYENGKSMYEEMYTAGKLIDRKEFRKRGF